MDGRGLFTSAFTKMSLARAGKGDGSDVVIGTLLGLKLLDE
jgi:hypothetical protein